MFGIKKSLVQISVVMSAIFLIIMVIFGLVFYNFESQRRKDIINEIETSLDLIVAQNEAVIAKEMLDNRKDAVESVLQNILRIKGIVAVYVYSADGNLISLVDKNALTGMPGTEQQVFDEKYSFVEEARDDQAVIVYIKEIVYFGERLGHLRVYYSLAGVVQRTQTAIIVFTSMLVALALIVLASINLFLKKFILSPINKILDVMQKMRQGDLGVQVGISIKNEVGKLAQVFNQISTEDAKRRQEFNRLNIRFDQQLKQVNNEFSHARKKLEDEITKSKQLEVDLQDKIRKSNERTKELNCLYNFFQLTPRTDLTLEEIFQAALKLIPPAWQYPEITCVRIMLENMEFKTANFRETIWRLAADITLNKKAVGVVEVYYLEEKPEADFGPFVNEERDLIMAIAEQLKERFSRYRTEQQQKDLIADLEEANMVMTGRELRMIELKKEINKLCKRLGEAEPYNLTYLET